jgi:hypothetical protein
MMSRVTDMMNHTEADELAVSQLSSLALDPVKPNAEDSETDDSTCASSFASSFSSSSQLSGWGSIVSRKSYACLRTLETESTSTGKQSQKRSLQEDGQQKRRKIQLAPIVGDSWGYFVDTPDCF